jgi:hypothetical protein
MQISKSPIISGYENPSLNKTGEPMSEGGEP